MDESNDVSGKPALGYWVLFCTLGAGALGFLTYLRQEYLAQPGLLALAVPAAALGFVSGGVWLGAVWGVWLGLVGGLGMVLRGVVEYGLPEATNLEWPWVFWAIWGTLGGIVCVIAGALAGGIRDVNSRTQAESEDVSERPERRE